MELTKIILRVSAEATGNIPEDLSSKSHLLEVLESFKHSNPKFEDAERMGFSTFGIPRYVYTYKIGAQTFSIGRGHIKTFCKMYRGVVDIEETYTEPKVLPDIRYVNNDFALDERQERAIAAITSKRQGLIVAATSAGKSAIILAAVARLGVKAIIVVHRKILLTQLLKDAERWLEGATVGDLSKCRKEGVEPFDISFVIDKTLNKIINSPEEARRLLRGTGVIIQDEAHLAATTTFQNISDKAVIKYRYGLTGTLKRKDRMHFLILSTFGEIIATITKDELEQAGRTTPVEFVIHTTETPDPDGVEELPPSQAWAVRDRAVHLDADRIALCADTIWRDFCSKDTDYRRYLVVTRYVGNAKALKEAIALLGLRVELVTGQEKDNHETCEKLDRGEIDCIVATVGVVSTGVNIKTLTDLFLYSPIFSNEGLLHQLRGRLMRKAEGKSIARMHLFFDENIFTREKMGRALSILRK